MTPPPLKTQLLGHPIIALPMTTITIWSVYQFSQDHDVWPMTVVVFVLMGIVLKANEQMTLFKARKRAWDGMAPSAPAAPRRPRIGLAILLVATVAGYLALTRDQGSHALALGWMVTATIGVAIVAIIRSVRGRRARRPIATPTVVICVKKPLLPVADLTGAYDALPPHCWQVLSR